MSNPFFAKSENNLGAEAAPATAAVGEPSQSKILTAGFTVGESVTQKLGDFLKRCNYCYCRKQIAHDSDIFMYGDLGAFCSAECRDYQIALDESKKGKQANDKEKK